MAKYKLEYLWLDGYEPVANIRGKTQIKEFAKFPKLEELPMWGFDGSSTRQAEGRSSDCMLKPVAGFPEGENNFPYPQGEYYTGVGYKNVGCMAREIVDTHLDICLDAGINHEGINAEVAKGQWEFQIFGKGSRRAADEMWMARYLMLRLTEKYGVDIEFHCKPLGDTDWNGSGMHC